MISRVIKKTKILCFDRSGRIVFKRRAGLLALALTLILVLPFLFCSCSATENGQGNEKGTDEPTAVPPATADPDVLSVLSGKTALFCGDSICMASTFDTEHQWWGWAGRIKRDYGLADYKNAGVDGASVSVCRGGNTVINQIAPNRNTAFDIVVLHGGVNDAWDSAPVGKMVDKPASETVNKDLDVNTFAGGLEKLFITARRYFPDSAIVYVINFRINSDIGNMRDMSGYWEEAKKICAKYDVPYLDLYDNDAFTAEFKNYSSENLADGIHPNSSGYEILTRYIAPFMAEVLSSGK